MQLKAQEAAVVVVLHKQVFRESQVVTAEKVKPYLP
jgi:hypothetical protein